MYVAINCSSTVPWSSITLKAKKNAASYLGSQKMDCHQRVYPRIRDQTKIVPDLLYDRVVFQQGAIRYERSQHAVPCCVDQQQKERYDHVKEKVLSSKSWKYKSKINPFILLLVFFLWKVREQRIRLWFSPLIFPYWKRQDGKGRIAVWYLHRRVINFWGDTYNR